MTVEVEVSDAAMVSPTSSSSTGPESLRLSEIESAHLCPAGRMKMEELFRQWLNVDGTKEMIQNMVADLRQGKELNLDAFFATASTIGNPLDSPSRSPKRPPNYHQFGLLSPSSAGSPSTRKHHQHVVSLFGDELHFVAASLKSEAPAKNEAIPPPMSDDVDMITVENESFSENNEGKSATESLGQRASPALPTDSDEIMEKEQDQQTAKDALHNHGHSMADEIPKQVQIPTFYTPGECQRGRLRGLSTDAMARKIVDIEARFCKFPEGMKVEDFVAITKDLCGFPSFFNAPFFRRILETGKEDEAKMLKSSSSPGPTSASSPTSTDDRAEPQRITKDMFLNYWMREVAPYDAVERFFRVNCLSTILVLSFSMVLPNSKRNTASKEPQFAFDKSLTVVVRIFYSVDTDSSGRITLRKLRRSNLINAFNTVDEEEDINKVNPYFSYEHFYVLYCKFWELDTDHDFLLNPDDLVRYGGHALTRIIVDRIFERGRRPFARVQTLTAEEKKTMSYEDFIC
ncbi:hypothetical protein PsorP6_007584 [Peronosclerospora sorghi]|uniref:Uncharacterized protein n=1 Tax=Peronosclerospora sorghi TaxID=230839 RepID=A0ACC0W8L7_9STRA|nr:hypothetical protein PsorP6_007584 [Peronosclerospora sorghi]